MKRKKRIILTIIILFGTFFSPIVRADEVTESANFSIEAAAAIAVDVETGKILYAQNADERLGIASITKIIGLYLVEEAVAKGNLKWDDQVTVSQKVAQLSLVPNLTNVILIENQTYSVKELFDAAAIQSANAAMVALAEKIAGSESAFVDQMKELLENWGIKKPFLVNSTGLNNEDILGDLYPGSSAKDENILSAKDIAIIARHLIQDYPAYLEVSSIPSKIFGENTSNQTIMYNTNWMLPGSLYEQKGIDGLKTGTTDFAGACFVGTFEQDGHRMITVILDAKNAAIDSGARFKETKKLMDYIFKNWQFKAITLNNTTVPKLDNAPVFHGKQSFVALTTEKTINIWLPIETTNNELTDKFTINESLVNDHGKLIAPLAKNQVVGTVSLIVKNDPFGYLEKHDEENNTVSVITTTQVKKANFFTRLAQSFLQLIEKN